MGHAAVSESNCEMVTPSSAGGSARRLLGASVEVDFERLVTDLREEKAALEQRLAAMERSRWALRMVSWSAASARWRPSVRAGESGRAEGGRGAGCWVLEVLGW